MPRAGFELLIPMFEQTKTLRVLGRAATGTSIQGYILYEIESFSRCFHPLNRSPFKQSTPPRLFITGTWDTFCQLSLFNAVVLQDFFFSWQLLSKDISGIQID